MTPNDAQSLQAQFTQLRQEQAARQGQFQTRSDQFEQKKNRELLAKASEYTVDAIVKGAADLQLEVSAAMAQLETKLTDEAAKLDNLTTAMAVAERELSELRRIRIAADALSILQQDSRDKLGRLQEQGQAQSEALDKEQVEKKRDWAKQDSEFVSEQAELSQQRVKQREEEAVNFTYTQQRERQQDADQQAQADRLQERELSELRLKKEKDWKEREAKLEAGDAKYQENKAKVEAFPAQLEEAVKKAREEGIRSATSDAKVKADLLEREWDASKQAYELQLESLSAAIEAAEAQVAELQAQQLRVAEQTQALAARAFKGGEA